MPVLPENVSQAWNDRKGPIVLITNDENAVPNAIYATCVSKYDEETLVVADNYFNKTQQNLTSGSRKGALLFITEAGKAYQIKGTLEYHTEGPIFDDMKKWNSEKHPGHAAAALKVEEVYCGAEKLA